jgi:hypothetical protein
MVSMPGATPEKFYFTVRDEAVAQWIHPVMGSGWTLHYKEKVGLPTSCFGETRDYVTRITVIGKIELAPASPCPLRSTEQASVRLPAEADLPWTLSPA